MMGRPPSLLFGGALAFFLGSVSAQESCVQVTTANYVPSAAEGATSSFMFEIEGKTAVTANTVSE